MYLISKSLALFLLLSISLVARPQSNVFNLPIDSTTGKITFQDVVQVNGLKKEDLFNKLKLWVINSYPSPKDVINAEDKDIGVLKLKPIIKKQKKSDNIVYDDFLHFDLNIYIKDGKYKYLITNLQHSSLFPGDTKFDKNPIERPFLISKDNAEEMKYYEYRKAWSEEIRADISNLTTSIYSFITKKNETDF